ncbi:MAG TPA: NAD(+)/NADH kinase [Chitinivibrionales bacterium]|nr:NAD(+)/NADH kinase [Chitinivibrionales bacterium]
MNMKPITSYGIIAFKKNQKILSVLDRIVKWSNASKVPVFFHPALTSHVSRPAGVCASEEELLAKSEALISVGGDGTFLSAVHLSHFSGKAVIGVNMGGIGFLTDIGPESLEADLDKMSKGDYRTTMRMLLEARIMREGKEVKAMRALNDIFINRFDQPKLVSIKAWCGGEFITEFVSDGLIIASPAGSTAYSLSAGGPIVDPTVKAFLLTPICPHSLTERPLILPCDKQVRLVAGGRNASVMISADGIDNMRLTMGDEVVVSYCGDQTNLLQLSERSHFDLLRTKLGWGKDLKAGERPEE